MGLATERMSCRAAPQGGRGNRPGGPKGSGPQTRTGTRTVLRAGLTGCSVLRARGKKTGILAGVVLHPGTRDGEESATTKYKYITKASPALRSRTNLSIVQGIDVVGAHLQGLWGPWGTQVHDDVQICHRFQLWQNQQYLYVPAIAVIMLNRACTSHR